MPYSKPSDAPSYVPADKRAQWIAVWNSAYERAKKDGKSDKDAEASAFAQANSVAGKKEDAMRTDVVKFIQFSKVDEAKRQVWGVVTAEVPDKDDEVCDYAGSVPYYKAVIDEMSKATDGKNFFPLREMHGLSAAGKCIGFDFRNADKEIFMGFEVVDDAAWEKVAKGVYTGFSHGGKMVESWPDPVYDGCLRYVANPSEVSLVDNPCLGVAHFTYVKADGTTEIRKLRSVEANAALREIREMRKLLEAQGVIVKAKTKRVGGKDLTASSFAYVGDKDRTETWKLPIHDAAHVRAALARFNQTQGIPSAERGKVYERIVAAAKKFGVDVSAEKALFDSVYKALRKIVRVRVNRRSKNASRYQRLLGLEDVVGRLAKGMYEVGCFAQLLDNLAYLSYLVAYEQKFESDADSELPELLSDLVGQGVEALIAMVAEEGSELKEQVLPG